MPAIDLSILNQRQTPAFYADVFANRPAAGFVGRIFVSTNTFAFYRDNGTSWDLIGGPGTGTVTGTGANGQVTFWNGASTITGSNDLFWDSANGHLGVNTNVPGTALDVHHDQPTVAIVNQTVATNDVRIGFQNNGVGLWRIGAFYNAGANDFGIYDAVSAIQPVTVKKTTGQVLIGTSTVGSGKLVVASATSDNGIQIVGANAPSLRIDSAESGPTKRAGLGISTGVNNFIQGSTDRDFCIFNGSTNPSPILFGIYETTNIQEAARITTTRNFLIGTITDAGYKLDVNGAGRFTGVIYADNSIRVSNAIIGTNSNNLLLSSNTTGGEISFWNGQLANRLMTLTGAGNLGLGISSPSGKLHIDSGNAVLNNYFTTGVSAGWDINNYFTGGNTGTEISFNLGYPGATNDVYFKRGSNGRFEIGTNNSNRLQILSTGDIVFKGNSNAALSSAAFENINSRFAIYSTEGGGTTKDIVLQSGGSGGAPSVTLKAGGNFLVGTTVDDGEKLQVNGIIKPATGYRQYASGLNIPNNTATTFFTPTADQGLYIVYLSLPAGAGSPANYSAYAIVSFDALASRILQQTDAANLFITLSGNNLQARQTSGGPQDITYRIIKIV